MTQQLTYDFSQPATRNPEYFFPLSLKLDPEEKANFINTVLVEHTAKFKGTQIGLRNVSNAGSHFLKTCKQTEDFIRPLGLKVHNMTLFMSSENVTSWVLHADGVNIGKEEGLLLEARLSYYEIAEAPGAIRWWKDLPMTRQILPASEYSQSRVNYQADCSEDIYNDKLTWDDIPQPGFSVVTSVPSAILRTNIPHHVIQGPGMRVTVSFQLVFENGRPEGVWEHIQNNINLIGA